jgi:hypothetical protein
MQRVEWDKPKSEINQIGSIIKIVFFLYFSIQFPQRVNLSASATDHTSK